MSLVSPIEVPQGEFGRIPIYTDENTITRENVLQVLSESMPTHMVNRSRIDYLWRYYRGDQPILQREKEVRPEINNKVLENRANEIVSFKTGYLLGEPMQYVARGEDEISDSINQLNDYMLFEDKAAKDKEMADWMHICGTAYRLVLPNPEPDKENPFKVYVCDPRWTFVVYSSDIRHEPVMSVQHLIRRDGSELFSIYTKDRLFEIEQGQIVKVVGHTYGMVPVIEYPANKARLGAFEIVIPLLDAINNTASDRMDGVDQFIQSFMKFINCDIDAETFTQMKQLGAIKISSMDGRNADVEIINSELNQTQTQTLKDDLYESVLTICGMPNRNGGSSTSDTGSAVIMRDGWSAAEARAKDTELMFKKSERQFLKLVLKILSATVGLNLTLPQIELKFTRRNYSDILTKSQVLTTMLASGQIHPELAFAYCGMFIDPESAYLKSKEYTEEQERKVQEQMMLQLAMKQATSPSNEEDSNKTVREDAKTQKNKQSEGTDYN